MHVSDHRHAEQPRQQHEHAFLPERDPVGDRLVHDCRAVEDKRDDQFDNLPEEVIKVDQRQRARLAVTGISAGGIQVAQLEFLREIGRKQDVVEHLDAARLPAAKNRSDDQHTGRFAIRGQRFCCVVNVSIGDIGHGVSCLFHDLITGRDVVSQRQSVPAHQPFKLDQSLQDGVDTLVNAAAPDAICAQADTAEQRDPPDLPPAPGQRQEAD